MWGWVGNIISKVVSSQKSKYMLSQKALEIAVTQIGEEEHPKGSNWGHPVQEYLASVGIGFPASWCMAFVYWCHNKAASQLSVNNPMAKTGGVLAEYNQSGKYRVKDDPQPGDVFIMDFGHGLGHTGFVESYDTATQTIHTIEGNSNDTGSREGFEVCRKTRSLSKMKGILRFNVDI
jgi:hypothetical protein